MDATNVVEKPPKENRSRGSGGRKREKGKDTEDVLVVESRTGKRYRVSACSIIFNAHGNFLGLRRRGEFLYQNVQGGVLNGETILQGAAREIGEEIGLSMEKLRCVNESVEPESSTSGGGGGSGAQSGLCSPRASFRYPSKSWKHLKLSGQELRPLLFYADSSITNHINFIPKDPQVRQEFDRWEWISANEMLRRMPPSKLDVMHRIFRVVLRDVNAFLLENHLIGDADRQTLSSLEEVKSENNEYFNGVKKPCKSNGNHQQQKQKEKPKEKEKEKPKEKQQQREGGQGKGERELGNQEQALAIPNQNQKQEQPVENPEHRVESQSKGKKRDTGKKFIFGADGAVIGVTKKKESKIPICRHYGKIKGCDRGDACRFRHVDNGQGMNPNHVTTTPPTTTTS